MAGLQIERNRVKALVLALVLAAVVGATISCGGMVVPLVFAKSGLERYAAGSFAALIFARLDWIFAGAAVVSLMHGTIRRMPAIIAAGVVLLIALLEFFVFSPLILAHGEGWPFSFASLHALASSLYLVLLAALAYLIWALARTAIGVGRAG